MNAIRGFSGENAGVAVVAKCAQPFFLSYDTTVSHHEIAFEISA